MNTSSRDKLCSATSMVFEALKLSSMVDLMCCRYFCFIFAVDLLMGSKGSSWLWICVPSDSLGIIGYRVYESS